MTRKEKEIIITEFSEKFANQGSIVVCNYKGMGVKALENVRTLARENNVYVRVIKNTLVEISLKNANCEALTLNNPNIFIWSEDQVSACKVADLSASKHENFEIKAGLIDSKVADLATISTMAKLPGRDELIGMLLNVWNAPVRNFAIGLQALATKKEEE